MPKYSLITPLNLWNQERVDKFLKTIESVKNINYSDFEWIVIDDGSSLEFLWDSLLKGKHQLTLIHKKHGERVLAYNEAFKVAKGDWWLFLDSDDQVVEDIFHKLDQAMKDHPEFKMFNFGSIHKWIDETITQRPAFKPKKLDEGHEEFGGGNIVNGTFVFHKSVYQTSGGYLTDQVEEDGYIRQIDCTILNYPAFPDQEEPFIRDLNMSTPYDFSAAMQLKFPKLQSLFMEKHPDHPKKLVKELGNPWGQDFAIFYQFTRKFHSFPIDDYLYIVNHKL